MYRPGLRALPPQTQAQYLNLAMSSTPLPDDELTIQVYRKPTYVLVTVAGEVDIATAAQLRESLRPLVAGGRRVVADLDQVSFIDAAGLGVLAGTAGLAAAHGTSLSVVCSWPRVRRLFRLTGLDSSVPLARTLAEALKASQASPQGRVS